MQTKSSLLTYKTISRQEAQGYLLRAVDLVRGNLGQFTDCFPYSNSQGGFYQPGDNREWTTGFWTGEIWLGGGVQESRGRAGGILPGQD